MIVETQELTQTHWQGLAHDYDNVMGRDPAMAAMYRAIIAELPASAQTIIDLGTGTGALLRLARWRCPDALLVGLDPAPAMLEQASQKLQGDRAVALTQGSASQLDFPDDHFDAVISNFALHHLSHPDKRECAREIYRVLRPGGRLIYGDQHCRRMGDPGDRDWVEDMFDLFTLKARHYLRTASLDRMLLQIRLIPAFLLADGEIPATVEFWHECLADAGFADIRTITVEPAQLYNRVIVAVK